jgi:hypothetical protein
MHSHAAEVLCSSFFVATEQMVRIELVALVQIAQSVMQSKGLASVKYHVLAHF